jgi:hypothetical protein
MLARRSASSVAVVQPNLTIVQEVSQSIPHGNFVERGIDVISGQMVRAKVLLEGSRQYFWQMLRMPHRQVPPEIRGTTPPSGSVFH